MPVVDPSEDAIDRSSVLVADIVDVDGTFQPRDAMVSSLSGPSLTEFPESLPSGIDEIMRYFGFSSDEAVGYISADEVLEKSIGNLIDQSFVADEVPAVQRSRAEDRTRYAVVVRDEGTDILSVVGGKAMGFPFADVDATGPAKTVVVIHLRQKTGRHTVMTSNPNA
eukprot:IDg10205t1